MDTLKIVLLVLGCILLGVLGGILSGTWYVAVGLPIVLVAFLGMWAIAKKDEKKEPQTSTPQNSPTQDESK